MVWAKRCGLFGTWTVSGAWARGWAWGSIYGNALVGGDMFIYRYRGERIPYLMGEIESDREQDRLEIYTRL